jgi:RHS repeat-associated protein
MITTVAPKPSHSKPTERHEEAHSEFFFDSYSDFADSNEQITKQIPAQSYVASTICTSDFCCNQQYSVTAITNATATIIASSAISNRYTYTGREWDATLGLHHFRARWMSPSAGRFLGRDPIGYQGSEWGLYEILSARIDATDPQGESLIILDHHAYFLQLLNALCPDGKFKVAGDGVVSSNPNSFCAGKWNRTSAPSMPPTRPGPITPPIQVDTPGYEKGTCNFRKSCKCICRAINQGFPIYLKRKTYVTTELERRLYGEPDEKIIAGGDTITDVFGTWTTCRIGKPRKYKCIGGKERSCPDYILLAHELCGHAVPRNFMDEEGAKNAIDIENAIRCEHGIKDQRDGSDHTHD